MQRTPVTAATALAVIAASAAASAAPEGEDTDRAGLAISTGSSPPCSADARTPRRTGAARSRSRSHPLSARADLDDSVDALLDKAFCGCPSAHPKLSSLAVPLVAEMLPWAVAGAVITVVSTVLCTELHARFTFATGRRVGWREHWRSAGSATAAYVDVGSAVSRGLVHSAPGAGSGGSEHAHAARATPRGS